MISRTSSFFRSSSRRSRGNQNKVSPLCSLATIQENKSLRNITPCSCTVSSPQKNIGPSETSNTSRRTTLFGFAKRDSYGEHTRSRFSVLLLGAVFSANLPAEEPSVVAPFAESSRWSEMLSVSTLSSNLNCRLQTPKASALRSLPPQAVFECSYC